MLIIIMAHMAQLGPAKTPGRCVPNGTKIMLKIPFGSSSHSDGFSPKKAVTWFTQPQPGD